MVAMEIVLNILLWLISLLIAAPIGMFALEVLLAIVCRRKSSPPGPAAPLRVAVLIPAHNEQAVIAATLRTLLPTMPQGGRVVVVADNCSDETAATALSLGAEVVERFDNSRRGKGYALDFGLQHLASNAPEAVVFLDADCRVAANTVRLLAEAAVGTGRPAQGLNLCDPDPRGDAIEMISGLAFRFKNLVRTTGLTHLASICHLTGTGMALPWALVERAKLADGNVVEDMQLGINLTLAGHNPLFVPEARVDSPLPQRRSAARTQRTRWEHGHLQTLLRHVPRLIGLGITRRRADLLCLALDLGIPPLSMLTMLWATLWLTTLLAWGIGGSSGPLLLMSFCGLLLAGSVLSGWIVFCRRQVRWQALLAAPGYILWKMPIYLGFLIKRQSEWIRTQRDQQRAHN